MTTGICRDCAENVHLQALIESENDELECTHCGETKRPAISAEALASHIEPIMREHFTQGAFDDGIQDGEPLEGIVYEVVGQDLKFVDDVVEELIGLDPADPRDGDSPLWDEGACYVETRVDSWETQSLWESTLEELKHSRRFFSPKAGRLFAELFADVHQLRSYEKGWKNVALDLPSGSTIFRARVCNSSGQRDSFFKSPLKELGPPPPSVARAGRMNAEGVPVLYSALSADTAIAEMRPSIGAELVVAAFVTTRPLKILDFSRLQRARNILSYLQPDFNQQVERNDFLRRLHRLITQPVIPGREADYVITQTMAEYLSHVVKPSFDGIFFRSAQHKDGINLVLFGDSRTHSLEIHEAFPISYVEDSLNVHQVKGVSYSHVKLKIFNRVDGGVAIDDFDDADE